MSDNPNILICDQCGAVNYNLASEGLPHGQEANEVKGHEKCDGMWRRATDGEVVPWPKSKRESETVMSDREDLPDEIDKHSREISNYTEALFSALRAGKYQTCKQHCDRIESHLKEIRKRLDILGQTPAHE